MAAPLRPFPITRQFSRYLWSTAKDSTELLGQLIQQLLQAGRWVIRGRIHWPQLINQMALVSWDALWMALILVVFSAMVIAVQMAGEMVRQGGEMYVGALISMAMVRELGPVMTAVALIAVIGTTHASELTTMNNTEQTQALKMMHVSPSRYLMLPRILATTLATPLVTLLATTLAVVAAMWVSVISAEITPTQFWNSVTQYTEMNDVTNMMIKGTIFGLLVSLVATTVGQHSKGGAREVGHATTRSVVAGFIIVALMDYLLTFIMYGASM